jgi:hypothetical protein
MSEPPDCGNLEKVMITGFLKKGREPMQTLPVPVSGVAPAVPAPAPAKADDAGAVPGPAKSEE